MRPRPKQNPYLHYNTSSGNPTLDKSDHFSPKLFAFQRYTAFRVKNENNSTETTRLRITRKTIVKTICSS